MPTSIKRINVKDIVRDMKIGWNLGNSLESPGLHGDLSTVEDYEQGWGNPITTKEMLLEVKKAGFRAVRIPVTWHGKIGLGPDYVINEKWLKRVKEVVDYSYSIGLYTVINLHHEDEWLLLRDEKVETIAKDKMYRVWSQIASYFKDYDEHLIFETMNETRFYETEDEWSVGTQEAREVINEYNCVAIKAIRGIGGNNLFRPIIIKTIAGRYEPEAMESITFPQNDKNLILSVHMYEPNALCMFYEDRDNWGSDDDKEYISLILRRISDIAKKKGIPVIIGEFGLVYKKNEEARLKYLEYVVREAKKNGIVCFYWDNNIYPFDLNYGKYSYAIFYRNELSWLWPDLLNVLISNS